MYNFGQHESFLPLKISGDTYISRAWTKSLDKFDENISEQHRNPHTLLKQTDIYGIWDHKMQIITN